MPWPCQSKPPSYPPKNKNEVNSHSLPGDRTTWYESLSVEDWDFYKDPRTWIPAVAITTVLFGSFKLYRAYLRRIPGVDYILPHYYHKKSLFGHVTSVGDGDGFHLFHTPGGCLAGWGWLRRIPTDRKELKGKTIPIRLAGIDAPEGAHFGRPAQAHASEALQWLQSSILHRYVRAHIYRRDQYDRVVATVHVRRFLLFHRDVGLEMLQRGLATAYEAKSGAEFGGEAMERKYRAAESEARRKKLGLWKAVRDKRWFGLRKTESKSKERFETPREFKDRMKQLENARRDKGK